MSRLRSAASWCVAVLGVAHWRATPVGRFMWRWMAWLNILNDEQRRLLDVYARHALQFAVPIYFGVPGRPEYLNNGTVTLLELGGRRFGITNYHVLARYRKKLRRIHGLVCQVGPVVIRPLDRLVSESKKYDLVVLDFQNIQPQTLRGGNEIPCRYHVPREWPPQPVAPGNFVMFGGFPRTKRVAITDDELEFGGVSSAGSEVLSVQPDVFTFQIQIEQCVTAFDRDGRGFEDLPGISGSPVLIARRSPGGIEVIDLVGIFFEDYPAIDVYRVRPGSVIGADGMIVD